jgi:WD40 repeat protein
MNRLCICLWIIVLTTVAFPSKAQEIQEIARLGRGNMQDVAWSPDGEMIAVASSIGVWLYTNAFEDVAFLESDGVEAISWNPDGRQIAAGKWDGSFEVWDIEKQEVVFTRQAYTRASPFDTSSALSDIDWSPDGTMIATSDSGGRSPAVFVWDATNGKRLRAFRNSDSVIVLDWSPDSKKLVAGDGGNEATVWDVVSGRLMTTFQHRGLIVTSVDWHPVEDKIASASLDSSNHCNASEEGVVEIWNATTGTSLRSLDSHSCFGIGSGDRVAWSPDGSKLVATNRVANNYTSFDSDVWFNIQVLDGATGQLLLELAGDDVVSAMDWKPDSTRVVAITRHFSSGMKTLRVWDVTNGQTVMMLKQDHPVTALAWDSDGTRLVSGSTDGWIQIWDWKTGYVLSTFRGQEGQMTSLQWSPDNSHLLTQSNYEWKWWVWDVAESEYRERLSVGRFASWIDDNNRILIITQNDAAVWELDEYLSVPISIAPLTPEFYSANTFFWEDGTIRFVREGYGDDEAISVVEFESETVTNVTRLESHLNIIFSIWSPDGLHLATTTRDGMVRVWDRKTDETITLTDEPIDAYRPDLLWHPSGQILTLVSTNMGIYFWDITTGEIITTLPLRDETAAWSPDGSMLATAGRDSVIRIWDFSDLALR